MANPKPKTEQLSMFESKWIRVNGKARNTKLVRIPEDILEEVMAIAHKLDQEKHGQQN